MLDYKKRFEYHLNEDMMASTAFSGGNSVGQTAGSFGNVDSYATGDARIPKALGTIDLTDRKKKKKNKRKKKVKTKFQRRIPAQGTPTMRSSDTGMNGPSNAMGHGFM